MAVTLEPLGKEISKFNSQSMQVTPPKI